MSFILILVMLQTSGSMTSTQLGPYDSLRECQTIADRAIEKMKSDTQLEIKASCVQEEPTSKEVKLYEND